MEEEQIHLTRTPVIALVGRTNVGKSTMFNRLLERKSAIMSPIAGTTTDIKFGHCAWREHIFTVIDTAGLDMTKESATEASLKRQAMRAMEKADIILFLVDSGTGLLPEDRALAKHLQKSKKHVMLVANKADNPRLRAAGDDVEWLSLGMDRPMSVSAANGSGVGDMLDAVIEVLDIAGKPGDPIPTPDVRVAIIGRPNVGKSSLLNALAGEERVIVSEVAHTTKEPQDTLITYTAATGEEKNILFIDTVGIRKKARVEEGPERIGVGMSLEEMRVSDVALIVLDATQGVGMQEKKLAGLIEKKRVGAMIIVNKWDLSKEHGLGDAEDYKKELVRQIPFYRHVPIMFISAKTGYRVGKLMETILSVAAERRRDVSQDALDAFMRTLKKKHGPMMSGLGPNKPKVYGISQTGTEPPTFTLVVKKKETVHPNFIRFIENRLREEFDFGGSPVIVHYREIRAKSRH